MRSLTRGPNGGINQSEAAKTGTKANDDRGLDNV